MNSLVIAFCAVLAAASASTITLTPTTKILEGPGSKTTLVGPDGSLIASETAGGRILIEDRPGEASSVAATAPQASTYISSTAPEVVRPASGVLVYAAENNIPIVHSPILNAHTSPVVTTYGIPVLAGGIVGQKSLDTVVAGPSGAISTSKSEHLAGNSIPLVHSPAINQYTSPVIATYGSPLLAGGIVAQKSLDTLVGPSGVISTSKSENSLPLVHSPAINEYTSPVIATYGSPLLAGGIVSQKSLDTVVAGPSGTISTSKSVAAPALVAAPHLYTYAVQYY